MSAKDDRLNFRAERDILDALETYRRAQPIIPSRSTALRALLDLGFEAWRSGQAKAASGIEPPTPTPTPSKARKNPRKDRAEPFDRSAYQRGYMRTYRAGKANGTGTAAEAVDLPAIAKNPPAAVSGAASAAQAPSPSPEPPKPPRARRKPSGEASTMTEAEFGASPIGAFIAASELLGIRWPAATKGHEERLAAMVRELRPSMSSRKVADAIMAETGARVSHAFVEALARAQRVSTRPNNIDLNYLKSYSSPSSTTEGKR